MTIKALEQHHSIVRLDTWADLVYVVLDLHPEHVTLSIALCVTSVASERGGARALSRSFLVSCQLHDVTSSTSSLREDMLCFNYVICATHTRHYHHQPSLFLSTIEHDHHQSPYWLSTVDRIGSQHVLYPSPISIPPLSSLYPSPLSLSSLYPSPLSLSSL